LKHDSDLQQTVDIEQTEWLRKCHKAPYVGIMLLRQQLFINAGTTGGDVAVFIICIWPVFGITIRPSMNRIFGTALLISA